MSLTSGMMTRRRRPKPAGYRIYRGPLAQEQGKDLPGNVRQRIKRAIEDLSTEPRPSQSRELDLSGVKQAEHLPEGIEVRRLRLDRWRVIYAVDEEWKSVFVLAVYRRPPYDYGDLDRLISDLARN